MEIVMELRHLRYFVAVAEELSFRRAAHRLHVSHPALIQQIHDLENELALKLFKRNSRRIELTEVGRAFLVGARRALAAAKQAVTLAQEAAKGERGRLVIGTVGPLTSSFLPNALARFRAQRPLVEVAVLHMNNRAQVEALLDGSIMMGIGYFGSAADENEREQLCIQLLLRSPVGVACSKHRRFPRGAAPKLADFRHDKFLSFDPEYGYGYEDWVRGFCRRVGGFEPEIGAIVNSRESLVGMIAAGREIFLGPEIGIGSQTAAIDFHRLNESEIQFELFTIWKRQSEGTPAIDKFIELLQESIKDSGVI
jgi:LysR family transcriptional regulator, benzoate and cis,cis-muconate-responsive activator of ben and cat genes